MAKRVYALSSSLRVFNMLLNHTSCMGQCSMGYHGVYERYREQELTIYHFPLSTFYLPVSTH